MFQIRDLIEWLVIFKKILDLFVADRNDVNREAVIRGLAEVKSKCDKVCELLKGDD